MADDWRNELHSFFEKHDKAEQEQELPPFVVFVRTVVLPAFESLKPEFERHGRVVSIRASDNAPAISIAFEGQEEMTYRLQSRLCVDRMLPYAEIRIRQRKGLRLITVESMLRSGPATSYTLEDITAEEVLRHVLQQYTSRVNPR